MRAESNYSDGPRFRDCLDCRVLVVALIGLVVLNGCATHEEKFRVPVAAANEAGEHADEDLAETGEEIRYEGSIPDDGEVRTSDSTGRISKSPLGDDTRRRETVDQGIYVRSGTGRFIDPEAASADAGWPDTAFDGESVSLNLKDVELAQVVEQILGRFLGITYSMDPRVRGTVSFSTAEPLPKADLVPLLEMFLGWHNAALIEEDSILRIVPREHAVRGNLRPSTGSLDSALGYTVRAFPLRHVKPATMQELIVPFAREDAILLADNSRNLLVMGGTPRELRNYERTIDTFDVDWLSGMSIAMIPLEFAGPEAMVAELTKVFRQSTSGTGRDQPALDASMLRIMPLERLQAVVVITPRTAYLARVREWVRRLDRPSRTATQGLRPGDAGSAESRLYVHPVHNAKATVMADTLNGVFGASGASGRNSNPATSRGRVAPALEPGRIASSDNVGAFSGGSATASDEGVRLVSAEGVRISAVEERNSLLIRATPTQYQAIKGAIDRLDRVPLQVLVEARILEVTLSDNLNYGVRWFLESRSGSDISTAEFGGVGLLAPGSSGFSFAHESGDARVVISALEAETELKVLSAPSLMALNNKEANITVGDQIPIVTTRINTGSEGDADTTTSEVQFRDTGVELSVRPRVNPGGLVFMEIAQNVSDPGEIVGSTGNREIQQRSIQTEIAVQSGDTIILGGLIRENDSRSSSGVPFLRSLPLIGPLFGRNQSGSNRTELIVLLTPRVIRNRVDARTVTSEYKKQFDRLTPISAREHEQNDGDLLQDVSEDSDSDTEEEAIVEENHLNLRDGGD